MIILKFGGTSVEDGAAIVRSASIIADRVEQKPVVVSSAMAGVTDELLVLARRAARGDDEVAGALDRLRDRHLEALGGGGSNDRLDGLFHDLAAALDELAKGTVAEPRGTDAVIAHGELLSTTLLTAALGSAGVDAEWVDAREILSTDDSFGKARPDHADIACRARRILPPLLDAGRVPVTQGFIGRAPDGATTTIGRGGSDYTAALLGAALPAEEVQIWTDVPGLMTADPRVVPTARTLEEVSYDEVAELAYFGAKVLHPAAIIPLIEPGIPLRVRNSHDPAHPGTRVTADAQWDPGRVKSVALKRGVTTVSLRSPRMLGAHGYLRRLFEIFDEHRIVVDVVATSEVSVSLSVENGVVPVAVVEELATLGEVGVKHERAIICVVGEALRETPGIAARLFTAVAPINVEMVSQGASRINVTLVVNQIDADEAVRLLHAEFFPG